jgi:hypothetical protein
MLYCLVVRNYAAQQTIIRMSAMKKLLLAGVMLAVSSPAYAGFDYNNYSLGLVTGFNAQNPFPTPTTAKAHPPVDKDPAIASWPQEDYVCRSQRGDYAWLSIGPAAATVIMKLGSEDPKTYHIQVFLLHYPTLINEFGQQEQHKSHRAHAIRRQYVHA